MICHEIKFKFAYLIQQGFVVHLDYIIGFIFGFLCSLSIFIFRHRSEIHQKLESISDDIINLKLKFDKILNNFTPHQ